MANQTPTPKALSPQAMRALEEAAKRRAERQNHDKTREVDGPAGAEPTRFGDWERKGIAYDF